MSEGGGGGALLPAERSGVPLLMFIPRKPRSVGVNAYFEDHRDVHNWMPVRSERRVPVMSKKEEPPGEEDDADMPDLIFVGKSPDVKFYETYAVIDECAFLWFEQQEGREPMPKKAKYPARSAITACSRRLEDEYAGTGRIVIDSSFASVATTRELLSRKSLYFIGAVD
jgi:hypothetical protein